MKSNNMYLIISMSSIIGGIETLAIRIANNFAKDNKVIFMSPHGPIVDFLDDRVIHKAIPDLMNVSSMYQILEKSLLINGECNLEKLNIWISHPSGIMPMYIFQKCLHRVKKIDSLLVSGIFVPAIQRNVPILSWVNIEYSIANIITKILPARSIYFMSDSVKKSFIDIYGSKYNNHRVVKLPLDINLIQWKGLNKKTLRIISIGRVDGMKLYNLSAPSIVKTLRCQNIDCYWDIYGEGDLLSKCIDEAQLLGVDKYVKFKGSIDYRKFHAKVSEYDVFVGMGTAALEAAQTKIPVILACGWERDASSGFLSESFGDSIGEPIFKDNKSIKSVQETLKHYSELSISERTKIGEECYKCISMKVGDSETAYQEIFEDGIEVSNGSTNYLVIYFLYLLKKLKRAIFIK